MEQRGETMEKFWMWVAWRLPRRLAYWCAVRVAAFATTGVYGEGVAVPDLTVMDALRRWEMA
jgi:hypothetical protein